MQEKYAIIYMMIVMQMKISVPQYPQSFSASLVMPSNAPRDKFFYLPLIPVCKMQDNIGRNINSCFPTNVIFPTHR